jgi:hypothetical protein
MQKFNWQLTAGQRKTWYGTGRFLRLLKAAGNVTIEVEYESPETGRISSGIIQGIGVDLSHPDSHVRFKSIAFESDQSETIEVLVTEFPSADSRLSGEVTVQNAVSVVDDALNIVKNDQSFFAWGSAWVGSGQYGEIELKNSHATKNMFVDYVEFYLIKAPLGSATFPANCYIGVYDVAIGGLAIGDIVNAKVGGAVPVGPVLNASTSGSMPVMSHVFADVFLQEKEKYRHSFERSIMVPPGGRLGIQVVSANICLICLYSGYMET